VLQIKMETIGLIFSWEQRQISFSEKYSPLKWRYSKSNNSMDMLQMVRDRYFLWCRIEVCKRPSKIMKSLN